LYGRKKRITFAPTFAQNKGQPERRAGENERRQQSSLKDIEKKVRRGKEKSSEKPGILKLGMVKLY
jgi:hypothetical protein